MITGFVIDKNYKLVGFDSSNDYKLIPNRKESQLLKQIESILKENNFVLKNITKVISDE